MSTFRNVLFGLLVVVCSSAFAAGGGGGGGGGGSFPSASAPKFDPVEEYQKGVQFMQSGEYRKAIKSFKRVLSVARKDANTNMLLGMAYISDGKFKRARKPLEKAIKYDANLIQARGHLGAVYQFLGKTDKAQEQRSVLEQLQAQCQQCRDEEKINRALIRLETPLDASAQSLHLPSLPNERAGDLAYVDAVEQINRGDYQQALALLSESAKQFGPHPDILTYQGFSNRKLGNLEQAFHFYQQALAIAPEHRGANEYLGEYYVEIGDLASAKKQLDVLQRICHFGCEEEEELSRWIAAAQS